MATLSDLRFAARSLRNSPGFAAVAILSLALGIGANTAIFTLLNALVFRQLPVREPAQLVQFTYTFPSNGPNNWNSFFGYEQYERFRENARMLDGVFGGAGLGRVNLGFHGAAGLARADAYTDNFFSVLGISPETGRFFNPGDDRPDANVAVIADRYWRSRFAADPSIVGQSVTINQLPFVVVGVAPPGFTGMHVDSSGPDLWVPLHALDRLKPDPKRWTEPFTSWMLIAGRLRRGVAMDRAQAELDVIHRRLNEAQLSASEMRDRRSLQQFVRESHLVLRSAATGAPSAMRDDYETPLKLLMAVAGAVLLIACANVASLQLARASNRRREIAVRLALGAGRGRVVRQILTESLLLSSIGGALALPLASWGSALLVRAISTGDGPAPLDIHPEWRIFAFTAAVSLVTGLLFGLIPGLRGTKLDPGPAMKERGSGGRSSRTVDRLLVLSQVALSVALVAGAGLFARTLQRLWSVDVGYDRDNILMFSVDTTLAGYPDRRATAVYREILERLRSLPGLRAASASIVRPVDDAFYLVDRVDEIDGRRLPDRDGIRVAWNSVSPGYFPAISTPILLGRDFDSRDNETAPHVVVVNESLAARALPGQNPIGHRLGLDTIVGVVKDARYNGPREQPRPVLYFPLSQRLYGWAFVSFELRHAEGANLLEDARRAVLSVDRSLPVFRVRTLRAQAEQALLPERLLATLSSFFGGLALLLACVGLYGLLAYAVARRTPEIGIRVALGARRGHVQWLVLRESLWLALGGSAAGIPLAVWGARYVKSLLFGVAPFDPATLAGTVAALAVAAALAGYLPARRAARVDPMAALRAE